MKRILYLLFALTFLATSCSDDADEYVLQQEDIVILTPSEGWLTEVGKDFHLNVKSVSDAGVNYLWLLGTTEISRSKDLVYVFEQRGQYVLTLVAKQGEREYRYSITVEVKEKDVPVEHHSPYITRVLDYRPAVGQFVNELPRYVEGDTQEDMNRKVLDYIGRNNLSQITLGGFGGYVILGFDHAIENVAGQRDFRVLGNAFEGSSEPGIIMVSADTNGNGKADDEWFEIAGSAHRDVNGEPWLQEAKAAGNDVNLYRNYQITYYRPTVEEEKATDEYIRWEDNQGKSGYKMKNNYHLQSYYPLWITDDQLTFRGTCLPQNTLDKSGEGTYFVSHPFRFGYADNAENTSDGATIDIDWAVDANGSKVHLRGVDFIKIYSGVNQENGWIGEISTEVVGVEDLHILGEQIPTLDL